MQNKDNKKAKEQLKEFQKNIVTCIAKLKNITPEDNQSENQLLVKATREIFYDEQDKNRFECYDNKLEIWKLFEVERSFSWASIKALKYLHDVSYGSRPDAWIWTDKFVVLIENKINGSLYEEQIIQHVKRKTGIKSKINDIEIEIITWEKLLYFLELEFKKKEDTFGNEIGNKELIGHFIKYLNLKNKVMDLNFVVDMI